MANCEWHTSFQMSVIAPYLIFSFSPSTGGAYKTGAETTSISRQTLRTTV